MQHCVKKLHDFCLNCVGGRMVVGFTATAHRNIVVFVCEKVLVSLINNVVILKNEFDKITIQHKKQRGGI